MSNGQEGKLIGKVVHYYGKVGVAVIKLEDSVKAGDRVRFAGAMEEFEQTVESMQVNHAQVSEANAGDEVAIKVDKKAREGTPVYKVEK